MSVVNCRCFRVDSSKVEAIFDELTTPRIECIFGVTVSDLQGCRLCSGHCIGTYRCASRALAVSENAQLVLLGPLGCIFTCDLGS